MTVLAVVIGIASYVVSVLFAFFLGYGIRAKEELERGSAEDWLMRQECDVDEARQEIWRTEALIQRRVGH